MQSLRDHLNYHSILSDEMMLGIEEYILIPTIDKFEKAMQTTLGRRLTQMGRIEISTTQLEVLYIMISLIQRNAFLFASSSKSFNPLRT